LVAGQERETILDDPGFAAEFPEYELRMQVWDTLLYLPNDILTKVDQASMAVSLEARVPLLDHRVAEFAWSLPLPYRKRGNVGKRLLRNVLSRYLPDELIDKSKTGFTPPIDRWLRGPLRDWADDLLAPNSLRQDGYLNADTVTKIWREHRSGHGDHKYALWVVLMFQSWLRS
jgi:asparagine synthase (glutamine-hydrolysing)